MLPGSGTWSLALWDEHRLRVLENRALGRIFGPKRNEIIGDCIMRSFTMFTPRRI
jgi:hypothetical protein